MRSDVWLFGGTRAPEHMFRLIPGSSTKTDWVCIPGLEHPCFDFRRLTRMWVAPRQSGLDRSIESLSTFPTRSESNVTRMILYSPVTLVRIHQHGPLDCYCYQRVRRVTTRTASDVIRDRIVNKLQVPRHVALPRFAASNGSCGNGTWTSTDGGEERGGQDEGSGRRLCLKLPLTVHSRDRIETSVGQSIADAVVN